MVRSQSTVQCLLRQQILKKTPLFRLICDFATINAVRMRNGSCVVLVVNYPRERGRLFLLIFAVFCADRPYRRIYSQQ
jgi:hypothetical protein